MHYASKHEGLKDTIPKKEDLETSFVNSAKEQSATEIPGEAQKTVAKPSVGYKLLTLDELAKRRSTTSESETEKR